ncbi:hypothetical protein TNCV_3615901 [Trichonephila clavipes]|nr:hypothetical protein TNCV_3615901 [Trichonephila clavipes]
MHFIVTAIFLCIPSFEIITTFNIHSETNNAFQKKFLVTKSFISTEAQLLPSAAATSSKSQPPVPFVITTSSASNSLSTSTKTKFTALSNETHRFALETTTSTSNSVPSSIASTVSQASKQKSQRKKRNLKTICNVAVPTVKPEIEIKMALHKPRKSSPIQETDDENMIVYDMEEQIETPKEKYINISCRKRTRLRDMKGFYT